MAVFATLLPAVDNEFIEQSRDTMGQYMVDSTREALKVGSDGWIDDDLEFLHAGGWGFGLSEVKVPVLLLQGDEDKMVPYAHGQWLAEHLPQDKVRKHFLPGQGHISILANVDAIIDELLTEAKL
jgi:pimeloyl-ACP methyl ester carboxylesterase